LTSRYWMLSPSSVEGRSIGDPKVCSRDGSESLDIGFSFGACTNRPTLFVAVAELGSLWRNFRERVKGVANGPLVRWGVSAGGQVQVGVLSGSVALGSARHSQFGLEAISISCLLS
jgi:hypothetical protein